MLEAPKSTMLGAIDAGSNAIRVLIARATSTELVRVEAERMPVRLGHSAFTRGELAPETIAQAVQAFAHFRSLFDRHGVRTYRAVATSAVRSAANRDVLLHRLHHEAGIELEVIEGDEEARLVRKAVLHAMGTGVEPQCILDLGGGSLEINLKDAGSWRGYSLPIGTVRLLESFGLSGAIGEAEAGMVRRYAATLIKAVLPTIPGGSGVAIAAATGGNADALALACGEPSTTGHPGFDLSSLERTLPSLVGTTIEERMALFNVRRDRAEVMGVAALVLATVARQLGVSRLIAPGAGVREAVMLELAEALREEHARSAGAIDKALLTAARSFANRVDHDASHGEHVRVIARSLFEQLRDVHQLPDSAMVLLEVAALLHDIGEVVHTRGHHKHSEYMIRWGRIPGIDDTQREMVALAARCHRKPAADVRRVVADSPLTKEQRQQVRRIAALLRLADSLDSQHQQRVEHVVCTRAGDAVVLDLIVRDGPSADDASFVRKADLFREEFGVQLRVTVGVSKPLSG